MGNKRNKKNAKNKSNKKQLQNNINLQKEIEKQQKINKLLEEKYITSKLRARNFNDISRDVLKAAWMVILGLATLGVVVFLVMAGIAYIKGNSKFANISITMMQVLTGVVSVIVGIWALYLAIKQARKDATNTERLNIVVSPTSTNIIGVAKEQDVNPESIG